MASSVFEHVQDLLKRHGFAFHVLRHEPVYTSEEAARVRDELLATGAKALICKGEDRFVMFVLPADQKLDNRAVRQAKGWRKPRFATREAGLNGPGTGLDPALREPIRPPDALRRASGRQRDDQLHQCGGPQHLGEHEVRGLRGRGEARFGQDRRVGIGAWSGVFPLLVPGGANRGSIVALVASRFVESPS